MKTLNNIATQILDNANSAELALLEAICGVDMRSPYIHELIAIHYGLGDREVEDRINNLNNKGAFAGLSLLGDAIEEARPNIEADILVEFLDVDGDNEVDTRTLEEADDDEVRTRLSTIESSIAELVEFTKQLQLGNGFVEVPIDTPLKAATVVRPSHVAGMPINYEPGQVSIEGLAVSKRQLYDIRAGFLSMIGGYDIVHNSNHVVIAGGAITHDTLKAIEDGIEG